MAAFTTEEFERNFKSLYKPLCLFALRYIDRLDDAEDIVQQAFADVWDKNSEGLLIGNLKAYLYQAVRNRSLSFISQSPMAQATDVLPDMEDTSEEEQIRCSERDTRLWQAIDKLPPERKKIFLLSKRDGLKYQEIADELNLSVKTVENQMGKALKALRETVVRIYCFIFGLA
ncbi:RNA polymerase sigma-70 factor [Parabacteroides chinchillae]